MVFHKKCNSFEPAAATASQISFVSLLFIYLYFYNDPCIGLIYPEMWQVQLRTSTYSTYQATQLFLVMWEHSGMGLMVLFKVYSAVLNMMKNTEEP